MRNKMMTILASILCACVVGPRTSDLAQDSTTCVSTPVTAGHPTGSISRCPPPDPYQAEEADTVNSAEAGNPDGVVDSSSVHCWSLESGTHTCQVSVSLAATTFTWFCSYPADGSPASCSNVLIN